MGAAIRREPTSWLSRPRQHPSLGVDHSRYHLVHAGFPVLLNAWFFRDRREKGFATEETEIKEVRGDPSTN